MPLAKDLLHPLPVEERRSHKLKRLVQHPNSYFMDVKCPGCYKITTVFSHAQSEVVCAGCFTILCMPTGGKARLTEDFEYNKVSCHWLASVIFQYFVCENFMILIYLRLFLQLFHYCIPKPFFHHQSFGKDVHFEGNSINYCLELTHL